MVMEWISRLSVVDGVFRLILSCLSSGDVLLVSGVCRVFSLVSDLCRLVRLCGWVLCNVM